MRDGVIVLLCVGAIVVTVWIMDRAIGGIFT